MRNPWKLTSFALVALLAAEIGRDALSTTSAEPQPRMRQALQDLRSAAANLDAAAHDKGGHRAKALELTRAAINQVEAGIRYDNRH